MPVLLVAPPAGLGDAVVRRLIDHGDDVRVVEPERAEAGRWRALGAHVAAGPPDADLIERAAHQARTIVLFDPALVPVAAAAAGSAGVDRLVVVTRTLKGATRAALEGAGLDFVALVAGGPLRPVAAGEVAAAIDAADDIAGAPRLVVDLRARAGWAQLGIERG